MPDQDKEKQEEQNRRRKRDDLGEERGAREDNKWELEEEKKEGQWTNGGKRNMLIKKGGIRYKEEEGKRINKEKKNTRKTGMRLRKGDDERNKERKE